ncbi:MAG: diaminopimelate epimerase [Thermodesulfobacteriota bacterium]|nr:diaminopimelate epimerase [Thermodesulfobacteriota bacterium]
MKKINFYKMSGSGNDFIIIDNRDNVVEENNLSDFISSVCRRKMSVGADGLILIENAENVDFKWQFYNSDGSRAEMCGNGARCAARFAYINKIAGPEMSFETDAGIVSAHVKNGLVKVKMTDSKDFKVDFAIDPEDSPLKVSSINTGVPHVVIPVDDIDDVEVVKLGRKIRYHKKFAPAGTNVNFFCPLKEDKIAIRTYERGVEDETLACGTGAVACALVYAYKDGIKSPVSVMTKSGGWLSIYFDEKEDKFYNIYLEGDARIIYKGEMSVEAMHYVSTATFTEETMHDEN